VFQFQAADTQAIRAAIFNPRAQTWDEHFEWITERHVPGLTPTGRAAARNRVNE
jgi:hypothetical protein